MNPADWFKWVRKERFSAVLFATGCALVLASFFSDPIRSGIGSEAGATFMMLVGLLFVIISLGVVGNRPDR